MIEIPLKKPKPDFDNMVAIVEGTKKQDEVLSAELLIDEEVKKFIVEKYFGYKNVPPPSSQRFGSNKEEKDFRKTEEYRKAYEDYHRAIIDLYFKLGYHFIPDLEFYLNFSSLNTVSRVGNDNALLSRGERYWAEEDFGMIRSWEDFEKFPWEEADQMLDEYERHLIFLGENLPEGMKIVSQAAMYEPILEWMLGYQGLFFLTHDDPHLVTAIFDKWGSLVEKSYIIASQMDKVGVIWHGDDLGFKTGTMLSPEFLRKWVFPWFKRFGEIAHENNKSYWYHCCGNKSEIMGDLIDNVKIDAIHAFEDSCCSVIDYKKEYGDRLGLLGGVDIDKLARLDTIQLKDYCNKILNNCMPGGRYIFGSGNSICNFIPVENYLTMLEVARSW
ncbi:uroporphyrinogen decarboxylase family protein [Actinomycetota bacterium]